MTENKRFILKENGVIDDTQLNILLDGGEDKEDMVDLLNELHEENEQLKNKYVDEFALRETLQLELQRIENENKELKQKINELQTNKAIGQQEYQRRLQE